MTVRRGGTFPSTIVLVLVVVLDSSSSSLFLAEKPSVKQTALVIVLCLIVTVLASCGRPSSGTAFQPGPGWIPLFNGKDLSGWKLVGRYPSDWRVADGVYCTPTASDSIYTERKFLNFKVHVEFKVQKDGNSGVFLRGRKEVQIYDSHGKAKLDNTECGAIFGVVAPSCNASRPAREWQTYDITIVGKKITVVLNGTTVIGGAVVEGVTGGQLDEEVGKPGHLMLQGDEAPVWFRNVWIKPLPQVGPLACPLASRESKAVSGHRTPRQAPP